MIKINYLGRHLINLSTNQVLSEWLANAHYMRWLQLMPRTKPYYAVKPTTCRNDCFPCLSWHRLTAPASRRSIRCSRMASIGLTSSTQTPTKRANHRARSSVNVDLMALDNELRETGKTQANRATILSNLTTGGPYRKNSWLVAYQHEHQCTNSCSLAASPPSV